MVSLEKKLERIKEMMEIRHPRTIRNDIDKLAMHFNKDITFVISEEDLDAYYSQGLKKEDRIYLGALSWFIELHENPTIAAKEYKALDARLSKLGLDLKKILSYSNTWTSHGFTSMEDYDILDIPSEQVFGGIAPIIEIASHKSQKKVLDLLYSTMEDIGFTIRSMKEYRFDSVHGYKPGYGEIFQMLADALSLNKKHMFDKISLLVGDGIYRNRLLSEHIHERKLDESFKLGFRIYTANLLKNDWLNGIPSEKLHSALNSRDGLLKYSQFFSALSDEIIKKRKEGKQDYESFINKSAFSIINSNDFFEELVMLGERGFSFARPIFEYLYSYEENSNFGDIPIFKKIYEGTNYNNLHDVKSRANKIIDLISLLGRFKNIRTITKSTNPINPESYTLIRDTISSILFDSFEIPEQLEPIAFFHHMKAEERQRYERLNEIRRSILNILSDPTQLKLIVPGTQIYKMNTDPADDYQRRLFVAKEFSKYLLYYARDISEYNNFDLLSKQIEYFFTPRTERKRRSSKGEPLRLADLAYNERISPNMNAANEVTRHALKRIQNQMNSRVQGGKKIFSGKSGQVIFLGSDLLYAMPRAGELYQEATIYNDNYGVSRAQSNLLDTLLTDPDNKMLLVDRTKQRLELYYLGGGSLYEEKEHLAAIIAKNIEFISTNEAYEIRVVSIDKYDAQMTKSQEQEFIRDVMSKTYEKLGMIKKEVSPDFMPNIKLDFIQGDFLEPQKLLSEISKKRKSWSKLGDSHVERLVISLTSTFSNLHDGKSPIVGFDSEDNPIKDYNRDEQSLMVSSAKNIIGNSCGRFILGAALKGEETRYQDINVNDFLCEVLSEYGIGLPKVTLSATPIYGTKNHKKSNHYREGFHQFEFTFQDNYSLKEYDKNGILNEIVMPKGIKFNITYSQRFDEQLLADAVKRNMDNVNIHKKDNYCFVEAKSEGR